MFSRRSKSSDRSSGPVSSGSSTGSGDDGKLDESTIKAVETSLREALTLNNEEARILLGRIEYEKQNYEAALEIFEGIEERRIFLRVKNIPPMKKKKKRGKPHSEGSDSITFPQAALLLEAVYLKVKSLQHLGRGSEALKECQFIMESSDMVFPQGLPEHLKGTKVHEIWNMLLEIVPNILLSQGLYTEAISAYRRAIRHVGLNRRTLQLGLAVLLLYSGLEAPECPADIYNGFFPSNSIEEAIYLLMTCVMNNMQTAKSPWDYEAIEHLCFALAIYGNFNVLAEVYESLLPGVYARTERWYSLALCYMAANQKKVALNLLKMSLADNETQVNKPYVTLHAALICTESAELATEGLRYGRRAVEYSQGRTGYLKGRALYILGVLLSIKAGSASSSTERSELIKEAVDALQEAAKLEIMDPEFCFRLGVVYAEQGNLKVALESAKRFLKLSSGASPIGWRFLALVLSAQARHKEAEMVVDAALQEMSKAESTKLLLTKAKLQASQDKHLHALETYKLLLTLLQSPTNGKWRISEVAVWQGMAAVFTSLSQWQDAEKCLEKAKSLNTSCAATWYEYGHLYMGQKKKKEALDAYNAALTCDPDHAESKVQVGALLIEDGKSLPVARSFLNDALRSQPRNASAWYYLGIVHETEGRLEEAIECFKTAFVLDQVRPVESFNTLM